MSTERPESKDRGARRRRPAVGGSGPRRVRRPGLRTRAQKTRRPGAPLFTIRYGPAEHEWGERA